MRRGARLSAAKTSARIMTGLFLIHAQLPTPARGYALNHVVADMREPLSRSGGSACPKPAKFSANVAGIIDRQWSTSLGARPVTILTQDLTPEGRLNEIESTIRESFAVWTGVRGTSLRSSALGPLRRTEAQQACSNRDGLNTICFHQDAVEFTTGVLAVTRVMAADIIGARPFPGKPPSTFIGEILRADILFRPNDSNSTFATPVALSSHPRAYDLESVLTHELGHFFGLGHSGMWRAMMYPYAPPPGQFLGDRPTAQVPDGPLADDDRTGLRVLYPDPADALNVGTIRGRILPANPLSLPARPPGVTGLFAGHVAAVDHATGSIAAGTLGGWSCTDPGPARFDGSYSIERLPVGPNRSYKLYVEPFAGAVSPAEIAGSIAGLCRNPITDPGWPLPFACARPAATTNFSARARPRP